MVESPKIDLPRKGRPHKPEPRNVPDPTKFKQTFHPVLRLFTAEELEWMVKEHGLDFAVMKLQEREYAIRMSEYDPLNHGFVLEPWKKAMDMLEKYHEVLVSGSNRSGKSSFFAWWINKKIQEWERPLLIWCFHTNMNNSKEMQQPLLWKYFPPHMRSRKDPRWNFTLKNGFGGKYKPTVVYENGSQVIFRSYEDADDTMEGGEPDIIWFSEQVPLDWVKTARVRLSTKRENAGTGYLGLDFTPIGGYTDTVEEYVEHAETLETRPAELLKDRHGNTEQVPSVQTVSVEVPDSEPRRAGIVYFHGDQNPFGGWNALKQVLAGAPREEILIKAYGIATKGIRTRFPKFQDDVHVVRPEDIPKVGTRYHAVDPAKARNWFMLWALCDADPEGTNIWIYREWPSPDHYIEGWGFPGMWAEPDKRRVDGKPGDAQTPIGYGFQRYRDEIFGLEGRERDPDTGEWKEDTGEYIYERYIDSRPVSESSQTQSGETTILEECEEVDLWFHPAPGGRGQRINFVDEGVAMINDRLDYDRDKDGKVVRKPKLFISSDCQNLIWSLKHWTGQDGQKGASKDPLDCLRMFLQGEIDYVGGAKYNQPDTIGGY